MATARTSISRYKRYVMQQAKILPTALYLASEGPARATAFLLYAIRAIGARPATRKTSGQIFLSTIDLYGSFKHPSAAPFTNIDSLTNARHAENFSGTT